MKVRSCATFTADLPDDHIEDGPQIVQFGGKSVAETISEILTRLGCSVAPLRYAHEDGWELDINFKNRRLWCRITLIDSYLLILEEISFMKYFLGKYHPNYIGILMELAAELNRDPRFHDVLWYDSDEVLTAAAGSEAPVTGVAR